MPDEEGGPVGSRSPRVLVADDAHALRRLVVTVLSTDPRFGEIREVSTGATALDRAREDAPDVILLDQHMPDGRGTDILPELRRMLPEARIVMYSSDDTSRELALERGADGWLSKDAPLDLVVEILLP